MNETEQATQIGSENDWRLHWGHLLRTARQVAGMSLTELSAATGLSKGYLSKLESGSKLETGQAAGHNPSRATLAALARALPNFRALAYTLETPASLEVPARGERHSEGIESDNGPDRTAVFAPLKLGWRELEVVLAVLTLERSAIAQPLTAVVLARAIGRPLAQIRPVLDRLVESHALDVKPALRLGAPVTYQRAADFEERAGLTRLGDALVLAAALLAQSSQGQRPQHSTTTITPTLQHSAPDNRTRESAS